MLSNIEYIIACNLELKSLIPDSMVCNRTHLEVYSISVTRMGQCIVVQMVRKFEDILWFAGFEIVI